MPKRKRPEEKPQDQFKRFLEAAKDRDVAPAEAERAFKDIAKPKRQASSSKA